MAGDTWYPGCPECRCAEQGQWAGGHQNHSPRALRVTATGVFHGHLSLGSKALSPEFGRLVQGHSCPGRPTPPSPCCSPLCLSCESPQSLKSGESVAFVCVFSGDNDVLQDPGHCCTEPQNQLGPQGRWPVLPCPSSARDVYPQGQVQGFWAGGAGNWGHGEPGVEGPMRGQPGVPYLLWQARDICCSDCRRLQLLSEPWHMGPTWGPL